MDIITLALAKKQIGKDTTKAVSDYLDEHLTNPTNPPLDTSLTIANAAADSKATGDKLSELKEGFNELTSASNNLTNTLFPHVLRSVVDYPFGTALNNAFVWVSTDIYIPKGQAGVLTCLNHNNGKNHGKTLHVIKLLQINGAYTVLSDETIQSDYIGVRVYISKEETSAGNVYVGFYSTDNGMVYQTSGNRLTAFKRFAYADLTVGEPVTLSGSFNMDYSFGLSITVDNTEMGESSFVIVDATGGGKYTSVIDAINTEPEDTAIFVKPGVYEQDMTECLRKRIILIGTDRNACIIRDTDGRYGHHALYISCGYFENLTIEEPYVSGTSQEVGVSDLGAYAVHIDTDDDYSVGKTTEFHHCTIKSDFFPALGIGLRTDAPVILDDCELQNNQVSGRGSYSTSGSLGALYFHDSNGTQGNQYITIKDCVLKSSLGYSMTPYQVTRNPQNNKVYCEFINNVLHDAVNGYLNNIWFRGDPFNASTGIFEITIGYGNSNSALNNN